MKKNITKYMAAILAAMVCVCPLRAQSEGIATPAALELMKYNGLWSQSRNAAGSFLDNPRYYATIYGGYGWLSGDFHMPQQGGKQSGLDIYSEGATVQGNFYAWGMFNYKRDIVDDALYNASIIDPYRGMPYYMIDDVSSEWRMEDYNLSFKVASRKYWDLLYVGLTGTYRAMMGAKQVDFRTANKSVFIELRPGVVIEPGAGHAIGLNFEYFNYKEESSMDRNNASSTLNDYEHWGLGMGIERSAVRETDYKGNSVGGSVQYGYTSGPRMSLLIEGSYRYKVEDMNISWTQATTPASVKDRIWEVKATGYFRSPSFTNYISLGGRDRSIDGIEALIRDATSEEPATTLLTYIGSTYHTRDLSLEYKLIRDYKNEYRWMAEAGVSYSKTEDEYLIPRSTMNYENITFNLGGKVNFMLPKGIDARIFFEGMFHYNHNIDGGYVFGGYFPDYPTVALEEANIAYLTSDYYGFNVAVTYSQKVNENTRTNLFGKVGFAMRTTSDNGFDKRQFVNFSVGCNF